MGMVFFLISFSLLWLSLVLVLVVIFGDDPELVERGTDRFSALAMEVIRYVNHSSGMTGKDVCDGVVERSSNVPL